MAYPVPNTAVRTSHSLTIIRNGQKIGLINGWNPAQSKTITPIFQIASECNGTVSGDPVEKIPGNVTGQTIAIQRYDLYTSRMEKAFGTDFASGGDLLMLTRQDRPFDVEEIWTYPDGTIEVMWYTGCWFSNIGRNFRSDGDRIINTNATLEYTKKQLGQ